ncbi:linear amide C-N hydrolase [Lactococcus hircilactis]|uniref:Linear amide C-N hydrolase n=1 Tax=Lactococcus hircilactis TaxID=1494462 RepID=A0A7X1Z7H1_9LACT|nr:choloylglycine hydrolase family protein [Lactococcus hircilactis]MQW39123.1 linear amide C-N hydrolase [Lactococcus hircilactis]
MCTSIQMKASDGSILFARTMDWHEYRPNPLRLPKNYQWKTVYDQQKIQNTYAILGVGKNLDDGSVDLSDGVNEYGLSVQKLTFSNASSYQLTKKPNHLAIAPFEFVLWALGKCRSVADLIKQLDFLQLMTDDFSDFKFGRNDLHFSATDRTGRMISIEPINQTFIVKENPIGVVTNAPKLEREIEKLTPYLTLTSEKRGLNQISDGQFSGKTVMPGGFTPTSRFVRATVLKERAVTPKDEVQNVIETWHILNSVTTPKSDGRSDTYTIYRAAVDLSSCSLYFQAYQDFSIQRFSFLMD